MKVYGLSIHFFYLRARVCVSVCAHLRDCVCVAFELLMFCLHMYISIA